MKEAHVMRVVLGSLVSTLLFALLIQGPAYLISNRLDWGPGWFALAVFLAANLAGGLYFAAADPDLVRERTKAPRTRTAGDGLASLLVVIAAAAICISAVYDSMRLRLVPLDALLAMIAGLIVFLIGCGLVAWTLRVNSFATTIVEVQEAREQRVITTGPYRWVRHPMYFGAVWFFAGLSLMLGSAAVAIACLVVVPLAFLPRILVEEAALRRDLPGYADYLSRVRTRILPGVF
jgi:protein-S-isoprenylcysteine O-methyltransferase Ste14